MSQTMKIKKGDRVHVLRGKDAGKEGRVIEALPKDGKVLVENINVIEEAPPPARDPEHEQASAARSSRAASSTCRRRSRSRT